MKKFKLTITLLLALYFLLNLSLFIALTPLLNQTTDLAANHYSEIIPDLLTPLNDLPWLTDSDYRFENIFQITSEIEISQYIQRRGKVFEDYCFENNIPASSLGAKIQRINYQSQLIKQQLLQQKSVFEEFGAGSLIDTEQLAGRPWKLWFGSRLNLSFIQRLNHSILDLAAWCQQNQYYQLSGQLYLTSLRLGAGLISGSFGGDLSFLTARTGLEICRSTLNQILVTSAFNSTAQLEFQQIELGRELIELSDSLPRFELIIQTERDYLFRFSRELSRQPANFISWPGFNQLLKLSGRIFGYHLKELGNRYLTRALLALKSGNQNEFAAIVQQHRHWLDNKSLSLFNYLYLPAALADSYFMVLYYPIEKEYQNYCKLLEDLIILGSKL